MRTDGPPIKFVAIWGLFALAMLYGQGQLISHGVKIAMPYQIDNPGSPIQLALLD